MARFPIGLCAILVAGCVEGESTELAVGPPPPSGPPAPTIMSLAPAVGSPSGGTVVTLTGMNFQTTGTTTVAFGATQGSAVSVVSNTQLTATTPAGAAGSTVNVVVVNPDGLSATAVNAFAYVVPTILSLSPTSGPASGGTAVTLAGSGFLPGATVAFGTTAATSVVVVSPTALAATTPNVMPATGAMDVRVTNPDTYFGTLVNGFSFGTGALVSGFGSGGVVTSNPSAGSVDLARAVVSDGTDLYVVGLDTSPGSAQWRIEKRSQSAGALVSGFGTNGVITSDVSTRNDSAEAVLHDGTDLYVVGYDGSAGNAQWRIEKRSLGTGALVSGFGTGGVVTSDPSTASDMARAVLSDGTSLYVVGDDGSPGNPQWRIEKRSCSTGALVPGFGSSGVIVSDPSTGIDSAEGVVSDGTDLYVVGYDYSPGNAQWRIEKRSLGTGALVAGFGTNGVVTTNPGTIGDMAYAVVRDGTHLYVVGWDGSPGNPQWRIEKRSLASGALASGFGTGGVVTSNSSTGSEAAQAVVSDGTNLHVVGYDASAGGYRWRIEKRSLATGALVAGFGTAGVITSNPSTGSDLAEAVVSDGTDLYVVGHDGIPGNAQWRIEKRTK